MEEEDITFPDQIDPVIGWRSWDIDENYNDFVLVSPHLRTHWPTKTAMQARCVHSKQERKECQCGLNAFSSRRHLEKRPYGKDPVIGKVALWGEVQEYKRGYRAQFAYPVELLVDEKLPKKVIDSLAAAYGVPVRCRQIPQEPKEATPVNKIRWKLPAGVMVFGLFLLAFQQWQLLDLARQWQEQEVSPMRTAFSQGGDLPSSPSPEWKKAFATASTGAIFGLVISFICLLRRDAVAAITAIWIFLASFFLAAINPSFWPNPSESQWRVGSIELLQAKAHLKGPYVLEANDTIKAYPSLSRRASSTSTCSLATESCVDQKVTQDNLVSLSYMLKLKKDRSCVVETWHPSKDLEGELIMTTLESGHKVKRKDLDIAMGEGLKTQICRAKDKIILHPISGIGYSMAWPDPLSVS